jgi:hypothetical protein
MAATGLAGSFMDPGVECGGASTGIGFGTNAIYDGIEQSPIPKEGNAFGIRRIGFYDDSVGLTVAGTPGDILVGMTAVEDVEPGASIGERLNMGGAVINATGQTLKAGQAVIGVWTAPAETPPETPPEEV